MKSYAIILFLLSYNVFSCPNFSGTYNKVMPQEDSISAIIWTIKQIDCDSYENESQVIYKDVSKSNKVQFKRVIDGKNEYWVGNKLIDIKKDANTQHCDIRGSLEQDQKNNLRYSWRFECPPPQGISPWYTPEAAAGWIGELYLEQQTQ